MYNGSTAREGLDSDRSASGVEIEEVESDE